MKKTVLITGASGGIGQELCRTFIRNNYIVIGTYFKNETGINTLSDELGPDFHYYQCDHSIFDQANKLITKILSDGFTIDILINNAGISVMGLLQDMDSTTWDTLWNTNVTSAVSLSGQVIPIFLKNDSGKIINISSVWGNRGASYEVGYSATKGAINTFTKALAKELAPSNIQVNAISCGIIDTPMNSHLTKEDINSIVEEIPSLRIGAPEDIAQVAYSLVTGSSYLTGQIITVDGGWQV